jgi:UDP-GlcNAc:undecaprenyl-phosphate GlcNAc-1-phosphate transferase
MFGLLLTFLLALVVSVVATFLVRDLGFRLDLVDRPDGVRKMHHTAVPRVGGMAVLAGTVLAIIVPVLAGYEPGWAVRTIPTGVLPLGVAGLMIFALGLADDFMDLNARLKFGVEGLVAAGLFFAGLRIGTVSLGPDLQFQLPVIVDFVITLLWFVGMSNAFNLIDGHDGVAGGVALLALATISYAAVLNGNSVVAIPALALSGAVLGFLLFNLPPASVFLGDAGSLFLGFTLAGLALIGARPDLGGPVPMMVPILALGLPVLDTALAVFRRFLRGDPVFSADRGHIHHRLRDRGYPKPVVTLFMWGISGLFALMAVMLMAEDSLLTGVGVTLAITVSLVAIRWLETPEIMELGRAVQRAMIQRRAIRPNVYLRGAVDLLAVVRDAQGLDRALRHAFQDSRADLVELWVPSNWEQVLTEHEAFRSESFGVSWKQGVEDPAEIWEISVALELASPKVGRLSLRFVDPSPDSLAHVDSVVRKLRPALCETLDRLLPPGGAAGREDERDRRDREEDGKGGGRA